MNPLADLSVRSNGVLTVRVTVPGTDAGGHRDAVVWVDGVFVGQYWEGRNSPGQPNYQGFVVRAGQDWMEVDLPPDRFPAGVRQVSASVRQPTGVRLESLPVSWTATGGTTLANTPASPPCFRDPLTRQPVFLRALFGASPVEIHSRPGLAESLRAAGVNCLFTGVTVNTPRAINATSVLPDDVFLENQRVFRSTSYLNWCLTAHPDFLILGGGDDWWQANGSDWLPFVSDAAFRESMRLLAQTNRVVGIDQCDETPFHLSTDAHQQRAARVTRLCREAGVNSAFTTPANLRVGTESRWYEQQQFSDHLSIGLDVFDALQFRPEGLGRGGLWQFGGVDQYLTAMSEIGRNKYLRTDCPRIQNVAGTGGNLIPPSILLSQIGGAICTGATGVKVYALDTTDWKSHRVAEPRNQIGTDPTTNPDRWIAMGHAFAAIAEHEARILQPAAPMQHTLSRWWLTRETHGPAGRFWLAVNRLESSQPTPPVPAWATRVEAVTPTGRVVAPTEVPAGSWLVATD